MSITADAQPAAPTQGISKKLRAGVALEGAGFGIAQIVRLGSNLILTRLLFPEAFGLMSTITAVGYALWMLSDVGIAQAVLMSERGDDPEFRNTAFTMQAIRGVGLWVATTLLAWPIASFGHEPRLAWMLPIASLASAIHGMSSTRVFALRRKLNIAPLVGLELTCQVIGTATTVLGAYLGYELKALLAGQLMNALAFAILSQLLPGDNHRDRFRMEPEARRKILSFGRWIFASSACTVAASRGDVFLLQRLLGTQTLGLYNLALMLSEAPEMLAAKIVGGVLYPTLARVHNERPTELPGLYYRLRFWHDAGVHTALGGLIALSGWVIDLLFDDRYLAAGPILAVLAFRTSVSLMASPLETCLTAQGLSQFGFRRNLAVSIAMLVLVPVGHAMGGTPGLLWGSVAARASALIVLWPEARRRGILRLGNEALVFVFLGVGYGLGTVLGWILPAV